VRPAHGALPAAGNPVPLNVRMNVVITGTSTGIGRALAGRLVARGHGVAGLARTDPSGYAAGIGAAFRGFRCDVSDWNQVERTAAEVAREWPLVDGLVCCAGIQGEVGRAVAADPKRWSATVRANLDGTYFAIRAFHRLMRTSPGRA